MGFIYFLGTLYIIYQIIKGIGVFFTEIGYLFKRHEIPSSTDVAKNEKEQKKPISKAKHTLPPYYYYNDEDDDYYNDYDDELEYICNNCGCVFYDDAYYPECPECYGDDVDSY